MTVTASQERWRAILLRQGRANAQRWLEIVEADASQVLPNYDNLLHALESMLRSSDSFDLVMRLVDALHHTVVSLGDWDRWLVYLRSALALAYELEQLSEQARILQNVGRVMRLVGHLEASIDNFSQSLEIYQQLEDYANCGLVRILLANAYNTQGRFQEALVLCQEALRQAKLYKNNYIMGMSHLELGYIYHHEQDYEQALASAQLAYKYFVKTDHDTAIDNALMSLVAYHLRLKYWGEANHYAERLRDRLESAGNELALLKLTSNQGIIAFQRGNYQEAEQVWQAALKLQSQIGELTIKANICNNLGMVYTRLGEWKAGEQMLLEAIRLYKSFGQAQQWVNSLDNLADLYEAEGDEVKCCQDLLQAISDLREAEADFSETPSFKRLVARQAKLCSSK